MAQTNEEAQTNGKAQVVEIMDNATELIEGVSESSEEVCVHICFFNFTSG